MSQGWTCRACSNTYHDKCEEETNGVYCICSCDKAAKGLPFAPKRCPQCRYVTAELSGHTWCINHKCGEYEAHMKGKREQCQQQ